MTHIEPAARRQLFERGELRIGEGEIGGKANGLVFFRAMLEAEFDPSRFPEIDAGVPPFAVIATGVFDAFLEANGLWDLALSGRPDEEIARGFQEASLSRGVEDELAALLEVASAPLAIRSSSRLEDAVFRPFAGVYETKMIPNDGPDAAERLGEVVAAVKLVYASTFFKAARGYLRAADAGPRDEKMAVVVQEIVGSRAGDRFYPLLSGVGRSVNFYPTGGAKPADGVVSLALGLGKTIVDGGRCWSFSPLRPQAPPPYGTLGDLLNASQTSFWAVTMGAPRGTDPIAETEYMTRLELSAAEEDGVLRYVASTWDPRSDRLVPGTGPAGPRVVDFAPILVHRLLPLNGLVRELLAICERAAGAPVEIEFAMTAPGGAGRPEGDARPRLGFLQVRPMFVSHEAVSIENDEMASPRLLVGSAQVMGNGRVAGIRDIVFVRPEVFEARHTSTIAREVEALNRDLLEAGRPYLLIGFGRWGSSDPWLGIPVDWSQISGAKVIVEATLPAMDVELSQGAHFFHNITGNGVPYLSIHHTASPGINWDWLSRQPFSRETPFLRHATLAAPLDIRVDGRSGRGGIWIG